MLLMMVVFLALTMGSGSGPMGMMGHAKPDQHATQKHEANPVQEANPVVDAARPPAEK